ESGERVAHQRDDLVEAALSGGERHHRFLVRGIEDAGRETTAFSRAACQRDGREAGSVNGQELERRSVAEVEVRPDAGEAFAVRESEGDRHAHVRDTHLRYHRSILELDPAVDDAGGM